MTNYPPPADPAGWAIVGRRVVVRYRLPVPDRFGHTLTDALGVIQEVDEQQVMVRTRRGDVTIDRSTIVAAKQVPPPPPRRVR